MGRIYVKITSKYVDRIYTAIAAWNISNKAIQDNMLKNVW